MRQTMGPILDMLDEGLRIYRRGFLSFALIAAIAAVPGAIFFGLFLFYTDYFNTDTGGLLTLAMVLLALPLGIYVVGALSRMALMLQRGEPPRLRHALAIGPLRLAGMGCFGGIFLTVANILTSIVSMVCFCPLFFVVIFGFGAAAGTIGGTGDVGVAASGMLLGAAVLFTLVIYALSLVLSGMTYAALIFTLQSWSEAGLRLGAAVQRSIDLLAYRFGYNLLVFFCASAVFGALSVAVTLGIGVLLPLPMYLLLGEESAITQASGAASWLVGLALATPPLPIWMSLLYQRHLRAREGGELAERIVGLS